MRIQNTLSHPLQLTTGVPQGSILGPVLFTVYVNSLLQVPKHCKAEGYVDDTKIFLRFPSCQIHDIINAVNDDLTNISRWCCANHLLINPEKTKLIFVAGTPQLLRILPSLPPVTLFGKEVQPVQVTKNLGIHIDNHLNYNYHIV